MSSAANHKARSHRSYKDVRAAMTSVQRNNACNNHYFDNPITSLSRGLKSVREPKSGKA